MLAVPSTVPAHDVVKSLLLLCTNQPMNLLADRLFVRIAAQYFLLFISSMVVLRLYSIDYILL